MDRTELSRALAKALAFRDVGNYTKADEAAQNLIAGLRELGFRI